MWYECACVLQCLCVMVHVCFGIFNVDSMFIQHTEQAIQCVHVYVCE